MSSKITKRLLDSTRSPRSGQLFLRDSELPGFGVRITKNSKTFILERRIQGRSRRISLGPYGPLTVDQARKMAFQEIARIAKGEDPAQDRIDRRRIPTLGDLEELYQTRHAVKKKSGSEDKEMFERYLGGWRNRRLSSIRRSDLIRLHSQIGERAPYAANRMLSLVRKMFNLAKVWEMYSGENPTTSIERFREEKRERFVQPNELPKVFKAIAQETNPWIKTAFLILLLTGQRKTEVINMKWVHLDLQRGLWRLPDTKANRSHLVPLPSAAIQLLQILPRVKDNPYVFVGRAGKGRLINLDKAWARIREITELHDVRIHDLRRTLGSWLAANGASLTLIGKALNHSNLSTTQVYARLDVEPVRTALEANADRMLALTGGLPALSLDHILDAEEETQKS